jgi:hypothetical protein
MFNVYGKPTGFTFDLDLIDRKGEDSLCAIRIGQDYAGREVEEEIPLRVLAALAEGSTTSHQDILGLTFESDGNEVKALLGVGSGNERFVLKREDLDAAIAALRTEAG